MTKRMLTLVGLVLTGMLAVAVVALAGHGTGAVPSYTGCLNTSSGTLVNVAEGDAPAAPCKDKETAIHLGGGDITAVSAGAGLVGGGDEGPLTLAVDASTIMTGIDAGFGLVGGGSGGDVTLAVDPSKVQTRVSDSCIAPGTSIASIHQDGSVNCHEGPAATAGYAGVDGFHDMEKGVLPIAALPLPAGSYLVIAKLHARATDPLAPANDYMDATCKLSAGGDVDLAGIAGDTDIQAGGTITLMVPAHLATQGTAVVACGDGADSNNVVAQMEWGRLRIAAVRLDSFTNSGL